MSNEITGTIGEEIATSFREDPRGIPIYTLTHDGVPVGEIWAVSSWASPQGRTYAYRAKVGGVMYQGRAAEGAEVRLRKMRGTVK